MPVGLPYPALEVLWAKQAAFERPLAVIITGNPDRKAPPRPGTLYDGLQHHLESRGYRVTRDPGLPHTTPDESAAVWVGHSRGAGRLRFAPPGVTTISVGSHQPGSINHPGDIVDLPSPDAYDTRPDHVRQAHMDWHSSMTRALDSRLPLSTLAALQAKQAAFENFWHAPTIRQNSPVLQRTIGSAPAGTPAGAPMGAPVVVGAHPDFLTASQSPATQLRAGGFRPMPGMGR